MKLKFLKSDSLTILKLNIKSNQKKYSQVDNLWIKDCTEDDFNFIESRIEVPEFELVVSDKPEKDDLSNIKILYSNLKIITDSQAGDERLWSGLCHNQFWEYMQKRWPLSKAKDVEKYIKKNYFFSHGEKRSLMTNALARLWWIGRLTYEENNPTGNPFELTDYLGVDLNGRGFPLFGSNFANNEILLKTFLHTLKSYEENKNIKLDRNTQFLEMIKYMNKISGKLLIDYLSPNEIRLMLLKKLDELCE